MNRAGNGDLPLLTDAGALRQLLEQWVELGWLRALDASVADFLAREAALAGQPASPLLLLIAALTSHQLGRGHVCLDIAAMARDGFNDALSLPPEDESVPERHLLPSDVLANVSNGDWQAALGHPLLVAGAETAETAATPLVRDGMRVYLRRYWRYEQDVFRQLASRLVPVPEVADPDSPGALALAESLVALFPARAGAPENGSPGGIDWQKVACGNAARQGFSVITGGPGTGKTTTVVKLLAALQHVALSSPTAPRALRIRLAAPTGKAAARLNESIAGAVLGLDLSRLGPDDGARSALLAAIPTEVTTLHRLLGSIPGSRRFRHHRDNPLLVDVLVVDEASMVDLEMMARVLEALPPGGRLILLGDKDQLASVDAGAVLGELCQRAREGHYLDDTAAWLTRVVGGDLPTDLLDPHGTVLDQAITLLRQSYRFDASSGIGQLASLVNQGSFASAADAGRATDGLFDSGFRDIARVRLAGGEVSVAITDHCIEGGAEQFVNEGRERQERGQAIEPPRGYRHYLQLMRQQRPARDAAVAEWDDWALAVLAAYGRFQLLCAVRRGPYGVEGLNQKVSEGLRRHGLIPAAEGWFPGRPVLVTRNDYSLGLMNGDIGIALEIPAREWVRGQQRVNPTRTVTRVAFPAGDGNGGVRWVLPSRLQDVETVFAMTVHKSQGSEFDHACLVMPDRISPVLTRELVYTGITRAKHWFSLLSANDKVFEQALLRRVTRTSGLGELLLGGR